jgi:hypothetical protein
VKEQIRQLGLAFPVAIDPGWRTLRRWWLDQHDRGWTSVTILIDLSDIGIRHRSLAERLEAIIRLYTETLSQGSRICICTALAGEYLSLPRPLRSELQALMADGEKWIARVLTEGRSRGEITRDSPVPGLARLWYAALQGALLLSRADGPEILRDAAATLKALTLARPGSRVRRNLPINR